MLLFPFLDRKSSRGEKHWLVPLLGILAIIYIVVMTIIGYKAG